MKKLMLSLATAALAVPAAAQQYIVVNGETPVLADDVERITYEQNDQFDQMLLPGILAADPKTTLFSQALQATGLADTLSNYWYADYKAKEQRYRYISHTWQEVAYYNQHRYKNYTVFAETDDVFAAQGITSLSQLKAYAKQVYDAAFPEDAGVSDLTDRRNSLNRFVAYHILKHGSTYWYLTALDKEEWLSMGLCVDSTKTDMSAWYGTLMPEGTLKCTYPLSGGERGLYLNRRGLGDQPDKYGKQVRGALIVANGEEGFDHTCFNGNYFHIDRILAYDQTTREEVLGSELWRVDFKTLSPDIMNNAADLRANYWTSVGAVPQTGTNRIYAWDCMENVAGDTSLASVGLVARKAHASLYAWQGDEMNIFDAFDLTVKLPPLPAGEWEVRMGTFVLNTRPVIRVYLNDEVVIDALDCSKLQFEDEQERARVRCAPTECMYFSPNGVQTSFSSVDLAVRYVLGRIQSDGKSDNTLRLQFIAPPQTDLTPEMQLDYFEFVPKAVFDNQEIPEE